MDSEKIGIIYLITSPSGGRYVGKTEKTLDRRWYEHCFGAKQGYKYRLHKAIRKYGPESFTVEEICRMPVYWLPAVEMAFIKLLGTFRSVHDYNMTAGGEGTGSGEDSPNYGRMQTAEQKAKQIAAQKGKLVSEETRKKISEAHKGHSRGRGRKQSPEWVAKRAAAKKGKKLSEEHVAKLRARIRSDETKAKLRVLGIGRTPWNKGKTWIKKKSSTASSEYFGVSIVPSRRTKGNPIVKWNVSVRDHGKRVFCKTCNTELEAAQAYNEKVQELGLDRPLNILPIHERAA